MKRIITVLVLVLFASICAAQVTFSGALLIGRIESSGTAPAEYDPSTEFNSTDWPSGYGLMGSAITLSGTAAVLCNTLLFTATPSGDWTAETLVTASTTEYVSDKIGLSINMRPETGNYSAGIELIYDGNDPTFYVQATTDSGNPSTSTLTATSVKLKIQKSGTELTFSYALDAGAFTVLASDPAALPIATAGYAIGIYHLDGDAGENAAFDYLRFTTP